MELNEKEMDKIIKKCYEDLIVPNNIFEEAYSKLEDRKHNTFSVKILPAVAAIISVIIIICITIIIQKPKENNATIDIPIVDGENKETEAELPIASEIINEVGDSYQQIYNHLTSPVGLSLVEEEAHFIGVVKVQKILGYTNYIKKTDSYFPAPFIISKAIVEKVYKGDLKGEIEMMSYGGIITVSDYIKSKLPGESIDARYKNMTEEEKENTFIKVMNSFTWSTIEPDVGKYYLVFMNYSENLESYQVLDDLIYEYDIKNDRTKNTETNEWEDYEFGRR